MKTKERTELYYETPSASKELERELHRLIKKPAKLQELVGLIKSVNEAAFDRGCLYTLRRIDAPCLHYRRKVAV